MKLDEKLFRDFVCFSRLQLESGDIDPTYPVLKELIRKDLVSREVAIWRVLLYVTWYDLASAEAVWTRFPGPVLKRDFGVLPTGIERRGFRGVDGARKAAAMLDDVVASTFREGGLEAWLYRFDGGDRRANWRKLRRSFEAFKGNGSWASYKFADLCRHVLDVPIDADDIGLGGGGKDAGPVPGLCRLYPELDWRTAATDALLHERLLDRSREAGVAFCGLDQLETCLCDFNSLCKGSYYVGHDIDAQQETMERMRGKRSMLQARRESFPAQYLGEVSGWLGVRKPRKARYSKEGVIE